MLKKSVKITYAEPWLPLHHRLFIEVVETCSARFALKKGTIIIQKMFKIKLVMIVGI